MFNIKKILLLILLFISSILIQTINFSPSVSADLIWWWWWWEIKYCQWNSCWTEAWIKEVERNLGDEVIKDRTFSEYIQDIVAYLLWFITLIAVIYIIYAWFRILVSSWDDETIKNSKKTIIYVIVWIVVIWFAYAIANFAVNIWQESSNNQGSYNWNNNQQRSCNQIYSISECGNAIWCKWNSWVCENKL